MNRLKHRSNFAKSLEGNHYRQQIINSRRAEDFNRQIKEDLEEYYESIQQHPQEDQDNGKENVEGREVSKENKQSESKALDEVVSRHGGSSSSVVDDSSEQQV